MMGWVGLFLLCLVLAVQGMLLLKVAPWNQPDCNHDCQLHYLIFFRSPHFLKGYLSNCGLVATHKVRNINFKYLCQFNKFREVQATLSAFVFRNETL